MLTSVEMKCAQPNAFQVRTYVRVVFVLENFEASSDFEEYNSIFYQHSWKSHLLVAWRDLIFATAVMQQT